MKNIFGVLVLGATFLSGQSANAMARKPPKPASNKTQPTNSNQTPYLVQVTLSHVKGVQGHLTVYKLDATGTYIATDIQNCVAIGGNPKAYAAGQAMETPDSKKHGNFQIYDHTPVLIYNGKPDPGFNQASYFIQKPSAFSPNSIAFHTAPDDAGGYTSNSHGCVRTPCAPDIYTLPTGTTVQIQYE